MAAGLGGALRRRPVAVDDPEGLGLAAGSCRVVQLWHEDVNAYSRPTTSTWAPRFPCDFPGPEFHSDLALRLEQLTSTFNSTYLAGNSLCQFRR